MPSVFSYERRVEFCETDAAGIAHFSSLIIYMEQAEHALLRSLGLSVASSNTILGNEAESASKISWPRVKVECEFLSPAKFEDMISVKTSITLLGSTSITYQHQLSLGSTLIAHGKITSVCCSKSNGSLSSTKIPSQVRDLLIPYVA